MADHPARTADRDIPVPQPRVFHQSLYKVETGHDEKQRADRITRLTNEN